MCIAETFQPARLSVSPIPPHPATKIRRSPPALVSDHFSHDSHIALPDGGFDRVVRVPVLVIDGAAIRPAPAAIPTVAAVCIQPKPEANGPRIVPDVSSDLSLLEAAVEAGEVPEGVDALACCLGIGPADWESRQERSEAARLYESGGHGAPLGVWVVLIHKHVV